MRVRQEYLKQQRDKLLALKKQVRERRLGAAEMEGETGGMSKKAVIILLTRATVLTAYYSCVIFRHLRIS